MYTYRYLSHAHVYTNIYTYICIIDMTKTKFYKVILIIIVWDALVCFLLMLLANHCVVASKTHLFDHLK